MHRAGRLELAVYFSVHVLLEGMRFSDLTASALLHAAGQGKLPFWVGSALHIPQHYALKPGQYYRDSRAWGASLRARAAALWGGDSVRDVSDHQWREFRGSLPQLVAGLGAWVVLSRVVRRYGSPAAHLWFTSVSSLLVIGGLHGACSVFVVALLAAGYLVAQVTAAGGRKAGPLVLWSWHILSFLAVRHYNGFQFSSLHPTLAWLDQHRGLLRWHIHYNLLLLRMLSYGMDLHAERRAGLAGSKEQKENTKGWGSHSQAASPAAGRHPLLRYIAYCLYPPLYIAGPIMTYTTFTAQLTQPAASVSSKAHSSRGSRPSAWQVGLYLLRWAVALGVLELVTRTLYFNTIARFKLLNKGTLQQLISDVSGGREQVHPLHFALAGFWSLVFVWLKFLVIWRLFRGAALVDGIDPPENMARCVCNNYDVEGFWKGWHCSYNRWLVKYMYIPLGGSAWRALNIWPIFLFVALWHDLEPRLLHWGLIMPAAMLPELAVKQAARSSLMAPWSHTWAFRQAAALLATANILALMCANLAGFVVGVEGLPDLITQVLGHPRMAAGTVLALFSAVQLMFALRQREAEARQQQKQRQQQEEQQESIEGWKRDGNDIGRAVWGQQQSTQKSAERQWSHVGSSSQGPVMRKAGQGANTPPSPPC